MRHGNITEIKRVKTVRQRVLIRLTRYLGILCVMCFIDMMWYIYIYVFFVCFLIYFLKILILISNDVWYVLLGQAPNDRWCTGRGRQVADTRPELQSVPNKPATIVTQLQARHDEYNIKKKPNHNSLYTKPKKLYQSC